jgi:integrase
MTQIPVQTGGGKARSIEGDGGVSNRDVQSRSDAQILATVTSPVPLVSNLSNVEPGAEPHSGGSNSAKCDSLPARGQKIGERGGGLARRRFQKGRAFLRGKKGREVWVGRWRDDVIEDGQIRRIERSEVLGSKLDFPTKRLALRELEKRLVVINDPRYRARPTATFADFASGWELRVLTQHKLSTQVTIRSHLRKHLVPFFGRIQMRDIGPEEVQRFVSSVEVSPKTKKNLVATLQMLWKSARSWGYVAHDAVSDVVLPKRHRVPQRSYTLEEIQRIIEAAEEPERTLYWLAAESAMRGGELCGLQIGDFDFERGLVRVNRSVWRGKIQSTKSEHPDRCFALSPQLVHHLTEYLKRWTPNEKGWVFATRNGTPWDQNLVVKRKLQPLLNSLGIKRGGLHAFRHANISLMDQLRVPLKVRMQRVGHSDPAVTFIYTHIDSEDDVRVAEQLGGILRPNAPKSKKEGVAPGGQPLVN